MVQWQDASGHVPIKVSTCVSGPINHNLQTVRNKEIKSLDGKSAPTPSLGWQSIKRTFRPQKELSLWLALLCAWKKAKLWGLYCDLSKIGWVFLFILQNRRNGVPNCSALGARLAQCAAARVAPDGAELLQRCSFAAPDFGHVGSVGLCLEGPFFGGLRQWKSKGPTAKQCVLRRVSLFDMCN